MVRLELDIRLITPSTPYRMNILKPITTYKYKNILQENVFHSVSIILMASSISVLIVQPHSGDIAVYMYCHTVIHWNGKTQLFFELNFIIEVDKIMSCYFSILLTWDLENG